MELIPHNIMNNEFYIEDANSNLICNIKIVDNNKSTILWLNGKTTDIDGTLKKCIDFISNRIEGRRNKSLRYKTAIYKNDYVAILDARISENNNITYKIKDRSNVYHIVNHSDMSNYCL